MRDPEISSAPRLSCVKRRSPSPVTAGTTAGSGWHCRSGLAPRSRCKSWRWRSSVPHGPQTTPGAVMASPRPTRYALRSQALSPCRGHDPGSRGRRLPSPRARASSASRAHQADVIEHVSGIGPARPPAARCCPRPPPDPRRRLALLRLRQSPAVASAHQIETARVVQMIEKFPTRVLLRRRDRRFWFSLARPWMSEIGWAYKENRSFIARSRISASNSKPTSRSRPPRWTRVTPPAYTRAPESRSRQQIARLTPGSRRYPARRCHSGTSTPYGIAVIVGVEVPCLHRQSVECTAVSRALPHIIVPAGSVPRRVRTTPRSESASVIGDARFRSPSAVSRRRGR